jgi:hypothetical protein
MRRALLAATVLLSSFLLFQIQPLIARAILPWFGGSAAVWMACMLFFQLALLIGYLYAHGLSRLLPGGMQGAVHVSLLLGSFLLLPIAPSKVVALSSSSAPVWAILKVLLLAVGLPYILLSATSPLLQSWTSKGNERRSVYRLFSVSNFGSILALLSFPVLVEPNLTGTQQLRWWSTGYILFVLVCAAVALIFSGGKSVFLPAARPTAKEFFLWGCLSAGGSAMLLAVTNQISENVAAIPLIWTIPLCLYLLSFVVAFAGPGWYRRVLCLPLFILSGCAMLYSALSPDGFGSADYRPLIGLYCFGLFVWCLVFHGELARLKPAPQRLTMFYLVLAGGGAVGAIFVAVVAPAVFRDNSELALLLTLCPFLVMTVCRADAQRILAAWLPNGATLRRLVWISAGFVLCTAAAWAGYSTWKVARSSRLLVRNFYGPLRVFDFTQAGVGTVRQLNHGATIHGDEFLDAARRDSPSGYYGLRSGIGRALATLEARGPISAGIVGLGAGGLAAYAHAGDRFKFYEINPWMSEIARNEFFFLRDSPAAMEIKMGDGRLSLEQEPPQHFDLLAVDAFSGDAIPVHLLTREALELYERHVKTNGVLALHISNRFLRLEQPIYAGLRSLDLQVMFVVGKSSKKDISFDSYWMLATYDPEIFSSPALADAGTPIEPDPDQRIWTDDYSSVWQALVK